jgi:hypothetical protein
MICLRIGQADVTIRDGRIEHADPAFAQMLNVLGDRVEGFGPSDGDPDWFLLAQLQRLFPDLVVVSADEPAEWDDSIGIP